MPLETSAMNTTLEVPDDLYRRAKAEAALRGPPDRNAEDESLRSLGLYQRDTAAARNHDASQVADALTIDRGTHDYNSRP